MDSRTTRHAEILVDHCCSVTADDNVVVKAPAVANDLVTAVYEKIGERGGRPILLWRNRQAGRAYARAMDEEEFRTKDHHLAAIEETDVIIDIRGSVNSAETSDVAMEKAVAAGRSNQAIQKKRLQKRWVLTMHPTPADAQQAEMSTAEWTDFVYNAINRDWKAQYEFQQQMADILDSADEVRIVAGETTDLRLSLSGMDACNDAGGENMPGGEVFSSPMPDSVEGEVTFDLPLIHNGREIQDAHLVFEDGEVVSHAARRNEDALTSILETDEGARRVGELGIGMNRGIDRFSYNMLFDEKMGDTVHLALGNAFEECVPEGQPFNESAVHVDMLLDMSQDSYIEVDGDVVQRNGRFRFEDGFGE